MANKTFPEISLVAFPKSAIPKRGAHGFLVGDVLGDCMNAAAGDSAGLGFEQTNPTVSIDWLSLHDGSNTGQITGKSGVDFVRFLSDYRFVEGAAAHKNEPGSVAGFILQGRIARLDCKVGSTTLDAGNTDLNFTAQSGTWKTTPAAGGLNCTRVTNVGSDDKAVVLTQGDIPANRSFAWNLRFSQLKSSGSVPEFRGIWGQNTYSLHLVQGKTPAIDKYVNGEWRVWKRLDGAPSSNLAGGRLDFWARRIGGYLVVTLAGRSWWFLDVPPTDNPSVRATPRDAGWPAGRHLFAVLNCRLSLAVGTIKYASPAGTPFEGTFGRRLPCKQNLPAAGEGRSAGWKRGGTSVEIEPVAAPGQVSYEVTLTAGPDGIDTPFVTKVLCRFAPTWTNPNVAGLEIEAAVKNWRVSKARPPLLAGAQATFELDRTILNRLSGSWQTYAGQYHPVQFKVKWHYDDGTSDLNFTRLFRGYIYLPAMDSERANDQRLRLTCRDPMLRLQDENARVNFRYPPLDILFAFLEGDNPDGMAIYGWDAIKEILGIAIGPDEANTLNGDGDGSKYFSEGHYALLSSRTDTAGYFAVSQSLGQPVTTGGWMFPAPYRSDVLSWLKTIAKNDGGQESTVIYYGWPDGYDGEWPVPIYGRLLNIIAGRTVKVLPDADYISGDINKLIQRMSVERRPDRNINVVTAYAAGAPNIADNIDLPIRMAQARLAFDDINAPEDTWERELELDVEMGAAPGARGFGGVEAAALDFIELMKNRDMDFPDLVIRGDAEMDWGDKVQVKLQNACGSDTTIGLHGVTFRVEQVEHSGSQENGATFETALYGRPLSSRGW